MARNRVTIVTPQNLQRFGCKKPAEVQRILANDGFILEGITLDHFLLHYRRKDELRTQIFSTTDDIGEKDDKTTQTLSELIARYRPGPGLFFRPPYVALVQDDLYNSAAKKFKRLGWRVTRINKTQ